MRINEAGLELVKQFEQCRLVAYLDAAGIPTIGWGHTRGVKLGMTCTQAQADAWLEEDLAEAESGVEALAKDPNENEFSAMVVFTYNVGTGNFRNSSVLRLFNAGDKQGASRAFLLWNKARVGGVPTVLPGLQRRRAAESALFLTPVHGVVGSEVVVPEESGASVVVAPASPKNNAVPIATAAGTAVAGAKEYVDKAAGVRDSLEALGLDAEYMIYGLAVLAAIALGYALYKHFEFHRNN